MALLEDQSTAFILRVWCESNRDAIPPFDWRGSIEHVSSGHRVFFRDTAAIVAFVQPYIESLLDGDSSPAR